MSHPYWHRIPLLKGVLYRRGFRVGTRDNARRILQGGDLLHTMPGGVPEAFRPTSAAYQLHWGKRRGYIRLALATDVPIIPVATGGIDELYRVSAAGWSLTRRIFPQLGGVIPKAYGPGPLPWPLALPQKTRLLTRIGPPISLSDKYPDYPEKERMEALHGLCLEAVESLWHGAQRALKNEAGAR